MSKKTSSKESDRLYREKNLEKIKEKHRRYRRENPEKIKERNRRYREANSVKILFKSAYKSSKERNLDFTLTLEDIEFVYNQAIESGICPILGVPFVTGSQRDISTKDFSPSLDRIDSSKGYIPDNIWIISWRANYLKGNATPNELILLGDAGRLIKNYINSSAEL